MSNADINERAQGGRPSMCRNCGAIVGAGERQCGQCGSPTTDVVTDAASVARAERTPERKEDQATLHFAQALFRRPASFTLVFLVANVLMFILTELAGGTRDVQTLSNFGAKVNAYIDAGQWWRFITPIFLHGGIAHLLMNMYGLWTIGPYVERLYGSAKFVVFWVVSGIAGVVASYLSVQPAMAAEGSFLARFIFKSADAVSVGASGALFGLIGVLFVFGIKYRHELPEGFKQAFGTGMLPTILLNIFIGYIIPVIDNAAHLGGLAAGAALAFVINYKRIGPRQPVAYVWHLLQAGALALVVVSFALVARNYTGQIPSLDNFNAQEIASPVTDVVNAPAFVNAINGGTSAFARTLSENNATAADEAIKNLQQAPALDDESGKLRDDLRTLLERARGFVAQEPAGTRAARRARETEAKTLVADYEAWQRRFAEWVKTHGGIIQQNGEPQPR